MAVQCPFCKSMVDPVRNAEGNKVCPVCQNTGRPVAQPMAAPAASAPTADAAYPPPAYQQPYQGQPGQAPGANAPGAVPSLVLGIVSFFLSVFGLITAILAIIFGNKAKRAIAASGGTLGGAGLAKAGRILGWIYLVAVPLTIILAAVVFVLVTNLSKGA